MPSTSSPLVVSSRKGPQKIGKIGVPFVVLTVYKPRLDAAIGVTVKDCPGVGVVINRLSSNSLIHKHYSNANELCHEARLCQVNGERVRDGFQIAAALLATAPAGWVTLLLQRSPSAMTTAVNNTQRDEHLVATSIVQAERSKHGLGLDKLLTGSVYVTEIKQWSPWVGTALKVGMHLVTVNNSRITSLTQAKRLLSSDTHSKTVVSILAESPVVSILPQPNIPTVHNVVLLPAEEGQDSVNNNNRLVGVTRATPVATALPLLSTIPAEADAVSSSPSTRSTPTRQDFVPPLP